MVSILEIVQTRPKKNTRLRLLADSTSDALPTTLEELPELGEKGNIDKGSTCITTAGDFCVMGNNGKWGVWI